MQGGQEVGTIASAAFAGDDDLQAFLGRGGRLRLWGEQAIVDLGMGENSTAQLGLSDLASQSVKQSISNQQSSQYSDDADMSAAASGLGAAAGMATNIYNKYY